MLFIFGGLPGTGKTTLAKFLSREISAAYIRIDTIEQSLRISGFTNIYDEAYKAAFALARENLSNGVTVVADSTNPVSESRQGWTEAACSSGVKYLEIEVICSDSMEHRARIENRNTDIAGLKLPDWQSVINREYMPWSSADIQIDTAGQTPIQSKQGLLESIAKCQEDNAFSIK